MTPLGSPIERGLYKSPVGFKKPLYQTGFAKAFAKPLEALYTHTYTYALFQYFSKDTGGSSQIPYIEKALQSP